MHETQVGVSLAHFDFLECGYPHFATWMCISAHFLFAVVLVSLGTRLGMSVQWHKLKY